MTRQRPVSVRMPSLARGRASVFERDDCVPQQKAIDAGKIDFHGVTHGHYPGTTLPQHILPGLRSLGFWDAVGVQDWGMKFHRNEGLEISLLETGGMDFIVDEGKFHLGPGSLTVTRPWQRHLHGNPHVGPGRFHWLILGLGALAPDDAWKWPRWIPLVSADLRELERRLRLDPRSVWKASPDIIQAFRRLAGCVASRDPQERISALQINLGQVLLGLLETMEVKENSAQVKELSCGHAVEMFLTGLASSPAILAVPWTLESMARRCGVGITALVTHCHSLTNTSPMEYLNLCRLAWAADRLLQVPEESVTEIALAAGYSSSAYFATRFRQRYGHSPLQHRRMAIEN